MLTLADLDDRTAFERFALESTAELQSSDRRLKGRFDMRTASGATYAYAGVATVGGADDLKRNLRPLMFGAAWKILDQIVEYAIASPGNRHQPIAAKVTGARALAAPPPPLGSHQALWDSVVTTYDATQELRNGLTHRRAEVAPDRELRVFNKFTQAIDTLSADEQLAMCRLSQRLIRAIISGAVNDREIFDVSLQLTVLRKCSGLISVVGRNHREICELIDQLHVTGENEIHVDVPALRDVVKARINGATYVDYIGWLNPTTVLCGELDQADDRKYVFQLHELPSWLHVENRLSD